MPTQTWRDAIDALLASAEGFREEAEHWRAKGQQEEAHDWDDIAEEKEALADTLAVAAAHLEALVSGDGV